MEKTLVVSQSVENSIKHFAGSLDPKKIIEGAKEVFADNNFSTSEAIRALDRQRESLDPSSQEWEFCSLQKLVFKSICGEA